MRRQSWLTFSAVLLAVSQAAMILTSPDFEYNAFIPGDYGCDIITGIERDPFKPSPPLKWVRPPVKTRSYVLLVDDIDNSGFVHWLVANIPMNVSRLDMDASGVAMPEGAVEYKNSYGTIGWGGPCPPGGSPAHLYRFRLFALNIPSITISVPDNATMVRADAIQAQLDAYTLYVAVLAGNYMCPFNPNPQPIVIPPVSQLNVSQKLEVIRYFKPSESFKKIGKLSGIYDAVVEKCKRGELNSQLCKAYQTPFNPNYLVAPFFPMQPKWIGDPRDTNSDEASDLSPAERAKRHVRSGGLQPINDITRTDTVEVPTNYPNMTGPFVFGGWETGIATPLAPSINIPGSSRGAMTIPIPVGTSASGAASPTDYAHGAVVTSGGPLTTPPTPSIPCAATDAQGGNHTNDPAPSGVRNAMMPGMTYNVGDEDCDEDAGNPDAMNVNTVQEMLQVEGDLTVVDSSNTSFALAAANQLTQGLERRALMYECTGCRNGYIPPADRRYTLTVRSTEFSGQVPPLYLCNPSSPTADSPSIPLGWRLAPPDTQSYVLMMDDVTNENDTDTYQRVHWLVINIPVSQLSLPSGASNTTSMPSGSVELPNTFGKAGYTAPCPSTLGTHLYRIRIYAIPTATTEFQLRAKYLSREVDWQLRPTITASMVLSVDAETLPSSLQAAKADRAVSMVALTPASVLVPENQISRNGPPKVAFFDDAAVHGMMNAPK